MPKGDELIRLYNRKRVKRSRKMSARVQFCSHLYPAGIVTPPTLENHHQNHTPTINDVEKPVKSELPTEVSVKGEKSFTELANTLCTICYSRLRTVPEEDEEIIQTSCSHFFHRKCLIKWKKFSKNCPICRQDMHE